MEYNDPPLNSIWLYTNSIVCEVVGIEDFDNKKFVDLVWLNIRDEGGAIPTYVPMEYFDLHFEEIFRPDQRKSLVRPTIIQVGSIYTDFKNNQWTVTSVMCTPEGKVRLRNDKYQTTWAYYDTFNYYYYPFTPQVNTVPDNHFDS